VRHGVGKRRALDQLFVEAGQVGLVFLPVDVREAEVQVAERYADGDVGQREMGSHTVGFFAQLGFHEAQAARYFFMLAFDPDGALFFFGSLGFEQDGDCCIAQAVRERFPALDLGAFAIRGGEQFVVRRDIVDMLDDDTRVEERGVSINHQYGDFAKWIEVRYLAVFLPGRVNHKLVFHFLLGQNDSDLAYKRAGMGADQLHCVLFDFGELDYSVWRRACSGG
jgi:hypothetical protein